MMPDRMIETDGLEERKRLMAERLQQSENMSMLSPKANMAASMGVDIATKGANPEGNLAIGGNIAKGALVGAQFGAPGAAVGAAAGLVTGMLGSAAAKKERERAAAANYYGQLTQIEGAKQARLQSAIENMSSSLGQTLLSNQKVSL